MYSQTWNLPDSRANERFTDDLFVNQRPAMSMNGFDNSGATSKGLGLKQVLNVALSGGIYLQDKLNFVFEGKTKFKIKGNI